MFYLIKFKKSHYSQFGEDLIIEKYFEEKEIYAGKYLDIGAFHPIWISNTYILSKKNWNGIVVDLDEEKLKLFKFFRKKDKIINKAVVASDFKENYIKYYKFNRFFSEINTVDKNFALAKSKETGFSFYEKKLEVVSINSLLDLLDNKINFLNIDAEGIDEQLIFDLDFSKNKINLICLESHNSNFKKTKVFKYLEDLNYHLIYDSKPAFCFAKNI